jgi:hypothetical protein
MTHSAEKEATFRCRLFGHRWEQALVGGRWRFRCRRCLRVEGYCGQADPTDLACCRIAVNCLTEHGDA